MSTSPRILAERYRLDAVLGAGGMATVYRSWDERLSRWVAVKILSPSLATDPVTAKRFEGEGRVLAALSDPHIVRVFDVGESDGDPWIVMELVEGETLATRLTRAGPLVPDEAGPVLASVAAGLATLHENRFIHRDVKPGNILLGPMGAKLADFGLVRGEASLRLTATGMTLGTLAYLAPEVLAGQPATPSSDVYALGVVAYETLTGRLPFAGSSLAGLLGAQAAAPLPPSEAAPWLSTGYDLPAWTWLGPAENRPDAASFPLGLEAGIQGWQAAGSRRRNEALSTTTQVTRSALAAAPVLASSEREIWDERDLEARRRRRALPWLLGGLAVLALIGATLAFIGGAPSRSGPPRQPAVAAATKSPTRAPTQRPTAAPQNEPTKRPTEAPQPDPPAPANPLATARAALDQFAAALADAQGGRDGLAGKQASELRKDSRSIGQALGDGELEEAAEKASKVRDQVAKLLRDEKVGGPAATSLMASAEALANRTAALLGRGEGGEDGGDEEGDGD
ncbi:MAG: protein kinase domain-containing protein [Candidatus Limnocylindrales bacterium]